MKYEISELVIEVGRNCNLRCSHCLRGEPQNVEVNMEHVRKLFSSLCYVSNLTITGGEPFLYPALIHDIVDEIIAQNIGIGSFFVATNGTIDSISVLTDLIRLYDICDDKECCGIKISRDKYHELETPGLKLWNAFDIISIASIDTYTVEPEYLIKQGRAELNYDCCRTLHAVLPNIQNMGDYIYIDGLIYLNALGDILIECDYSYESQLVHSYGNLSDKSFAEIVNNIQEY